MEGYTSKKMSDFNLLRFEVASCLSSVSRERPISPLAHFNNGGKKDINVKNSPYKNPTSSYSSNSVNTFSFASAVALKHRANHGEKIDNNDNNKNQYINKGTMPAKITFRSPKPMFVCSNDQNQGVECKQRINKSRLDEVLKNPLASPSNNEAVPNSFPNSSTLVINEKKVDINNNNKTEEIGRAHV